MGWLKKKEPSVDDKIKDAACRLYRLLGSIDMPAKSVKIAEGVNFESGYNSFSFYGHDGAYLFSVCSMYYPGVTSYDYAMFGKCLNLSKDDKLSIILRVTEKVRPWVDKAMSEQASKKMASLYGAGLL